MKKLTLLITSISLFVLSATAQTSIKASNAMNHVGEQVLVVDNIAGIKVYNDSTAVVQLGGKKADINVVFDFNIKFDNYVLKSFKESKIAVTGFIVLVENEPTIVITDKQNLKFVSTKINQKWNIIAQAH